jgi:hypothetical protein
LLITYSIGNYAFKVEDFLPMNLFGEITDVRVDRKKIILTETKERIRRKKLTNDGKLTTLAAHHPARMLTQVGDNPIAMGNRHELLGRILRVITDEEFDGVMGTPDIIEELFIVSYPPLKLVGLQLGVVWCDLSNPSPCQARLLTEALPPGN